MLDAIEGVGGPDAGVRGGARCGELRGHPAEGPGAAVRIAVGVRARVGRALPVLDRGADA